MKLLNMTIIRFLVTFVIVASLAGCSQPSTSDVADASAKQSAADVKQGENDASIGQSIANTHARLADATHPNLRNVQTLYEQHASHVQVEDAGSVVKVLSDDNQGVRHQRFLVKVTSGQTLLFAHNIDLASRVENIKTGDHIAFRGEYIWNEKGGIVHWTHRDPQGHHYDGWIKHNGVTYQ